MSRDPERPVGVRLVDDEGHEWPVEVVHIGTDPNGVEVWEVHDQQPLPPYVVGLRCRKLPGRSAVMLHGHPMQERHNGVPQ